MTSQIVFVPSAENRKPNRYPTSNKKGVASANRQNPVAIGPLSASRTSKGPKAIATLPATNAAKASIRGGC